VGSLSHPVPSVELAALVRERLADGGRPVVVAIDGRSGTGKSTLAARLAAELGSGPDPVGVAIIEGDDFYAGGTATAWDRRSASEKADHVVDRRRERAVLEALRAWGVATWHPFDWDSDRWDQDPPPFADRPRTVEAAPVMILEGAYSCHPDLQDLVDLQVLLVLPDDLRRARLFAREGDDHDPGWDARWSEAEEHYFGTVMPPDRFDAVLAAP
jgi:uridine kinase